MIRHNALVVSLCDVGMADIAIAGGKGASLGEMMRELTGTGVRIPGGFVVTTEAYRFFIRESGTEEFIRAHLKDINHVDVDTLAERGKAIRNAIEGAAVPEALEAAITKAYAEMEAIAGKNIDVAVRSSATAEDLPGASFAGQHETYLGVRGAVKVCEAVRSCIASLFNDRAISYRADKGFDHFSVALAVIVQRMVRADVHPGSSGVLFTLDTDSGFRDAVIINGTWGLGETLVQGAIVPDEFVLWKRGLAMGMKPVIAKKIGKKEVKMVYHNGEEKADQPLRTIATSDDLRRLFTLSDDEAVTLASWGVAIEEHYSKKKGAWVPMDIEWAKDGTTGDLFIVQARPETVHAGRDRGVKREYIRTSSGAVRVRGIAIGSKIVAGVARVIDDVSRINEFKPGEILVTRTTDPNWEPIMKIAGALITETGGRTSHAAIVCRELGITAVVGASGALSALATGECITVDTSASEGLVYEGTLSFDVREQHTADLPATTTKIMLNIATPETAFEKSFLPVHGVGLAREEFIIASMVGIHPMALLEYEKLPGELQRKIREKMLGWKDRVAFYVDNLAYGIATIAAAFYPYPVIVRFSDFKTNEYRSLVGGELYEPQEENPMLGWRGASRYYDSKFKEAFLLECAALKKVREDMGLSNVIPMVPFCRTPEEGEKTLAVMAEGGLVSLSLARKRGIPAEQALPVYVMCEIPSNVILADDFLDIFDGMSIGSNDLTQLVLGLDRDSGIVSHVANENNPAVKAMLSMVIQKCRARGKYVGICGQAPSDHPEFAAFLVEQGIESISLNPDTVVAMTHTIAQAEAKREPKQ